MARRATATAQTSAPVAAPKNTASADVPRTQANTVTVACKIANGLKLQLVRQVDFVEDTRSGPIQRKRWDKYGPIVIVRGPAAPVAPLKPFRGPDEMASGFALTHGVDADFFDKWLEQNKQHPAVTSGMIYASDRIDEVRGHAKEHKSDLSGMEPLAQEGDPRLPRPTHSEVTGIETADDKA